MAESFPPPHDLVAVFLLVIDVNVFDGTPVRDMPALVFTERSVEHSCRAKKPHVSPVQRSHWTALDALLLAYQQVERILHGAGTADCILDRIQREAAILDGNCGRFGDDVPLDCFRTKRWKLLAVVGQPQQLVGVTSVAAMVFFLANRDDSELPEADRLRVREAEYGDALELAGQTLGAVRERIVRDDEDQDSCRL